MAQSLSFVVVVQHTGRHSRGALVRSCWIALLLSMLRRGSHLTKASPAPCTELSAEGTGPGLALTGAEGPGLELYLFCQPWASHLSGNDTGANCTQ